MRYEMCDCFAILNDLREGMYFVDKDRGITFWNKGAEQITGFSAHEMIGRSCFDNLLNHVDGLGRQLCLDGCPLQETLKDGKLREAQVYLHHKNGHRVRVDIQVKPLVLNGEIVGAAEVFSDAGLEEASDLSVKELEQLALYDQLTELPNRRYIDTFLANQLRDFQELGIPFGIMIMDLDFFKRVNDQYGHNMGDEVLRMVTKTFQSTLRRNDFIGRWGGEEFIVVLRGVSEAEMNTIAEKVCKVTGKSELERDGAALCVTISIGATMIRGGDNAASVIQRADEALYASKKNGRNRVTLF
ncbi:MAG: GGDEF domain-containing protein [Eubacteriales bacterium]|nr:GGDEF domain-containing protein [Eubacteriales bacterium]